MAYIPIYSRPFLEQVFRRPTNRRQMIWDAANHTYQDPDHHDYVRHYLHPFKQKHPTTDKQYTLYFTKVSVNEVFFIWVNDDSCLHTTRANYDDPCTKKFLKLKKDNELETYDTQFHHPQFEIHPKAVLPLKCRSRYLGFEVSISSNKIGSSYEAHSFACDDPHHEIAIIHTQKFLKALSAHVRMLTVSFKITLFIQGNEDLIILLRNSFEASDWNLSEDAEEFVLEAI